ncbi:MAG TPA: OsmC family protein [Pyrinomonadaceae bacterium]|jgi:putative redox protein|nr:OsmC family protein [Pyrinomonadaceae bacterium]
MGEVTVTSLSNLRNEAGYGGGAFITDEPKELGGEGAGPDPYTLLLAALGSCISMTLTMYARRKGWPLEGVRVTLRQRRVHARDCEACGEDKPDDFVHQIERAVEITGALSEEQRARLLEIAHKCPVHRTLTSPIFITDFEGAEG